MKRLVAFAALVFVASSAVAADETKHTIQVRGTGTVMVIPDRVSFVAGVETLSASAKSADPAAIRQTALERAYADALSQAQHLAAAAGKTLGGPLDITTEVFAMPQAVAETITVAAAAPGLPLQSGMQEFSSTILVTFELK